MKYFLDRDRDGHWHLIDHNFREQWTSWLELDDVDPIGWNTPEYAKMIGTSPSNIIFENPVDLLDNVRFYNGNTTSPHASSYNTFGITLSARK